MNQPKIMGIPYDPILEPERRIHGYLKGLEDLAGSTLTEGGRIGLQAAQNLALIWFQDEVNVINLIKQ